MIEDGGKIRAGWDGSTWGPPSLSVAPSDTSSAQVAVLGAGSELAAGGSMYLGEQGTVALNVADGGAVSAGHYQGDSGVIAIALATTSI